MFPKPEPKLSPNTYAFESQPMVKPTGFREYDARWLFEKEINLMGAQALGLGLARLLKEMGVAREVVVGSPYDFREQALLYVPRTMPDPRSEGFTERAAEEVLSLLALSEGRALVLTSSYRGLDVLRERACGHGGRIAAVFCRREPDDLVD